MHIYVCVFVKSFHLEHLNAAIISRLFIVVDVDVRSFVSWLVVRRHCRHRHYCSRRRLAHDQQHGACVQFSSAPLRSRFLVVSLYVSHTYTHERHRMIYSNKNLLLAVSNEKERISAQYTHIYM